MENITPTRHVFKVGHLIRLNKRIGFIAAGTLCLIYDRYSFPGREGLSVITKDGVNIGGFGIDEMHLIFSFVRNSFFQYNYANNTQLKMDWKDGMFKTAFEVAK